MCVVSKRSEISVNLQQSLQLSSGNMPDCSVETPGSNNTVGSLLNTRDAVIYNLGQLNTLTAVSILT